jgi:PAS domain S-box-containing protein
LKVKLATKYKIAVGLTIGFFLFYFISTLVYTEVLGERSFIEELLFVGSLQQIIFKALILFQFAVFSLIIYKIAAKNVQTEKMLKETEQRWAATLASIGDAVIITDNIGKVSYMNTEAERLTGWKLKDGKQKPAKQIFRIVNNPTGIAEYHPISQVLENKLPFKVAGYSDLLNKEGKSYTIESSAAPIKDEGNNVKEIVLIFHDLTTKRNKEIELINSKDFNENIIDSITDPLYVLDPTNFRILAVNAEASRSLKLSKIELIGKTCHEMTHHKLTPCGGSLHTCPMKEVLDTGKTAAVEHIHSDQDRNPMRIEVTLYPIKNKDQQITQVIHLEKNITKRKDF